jgi:putative ABC transport system permease protein
MGTLLQDLRYGARMMARSPGFTVLAVVALALGIGANTAVFSVANAFLRKPVSFPDLDRLVAVVSMTPIQTLEWNEVSPADYLDWKEQSRSFERMGAYQWDQVNITGTADPQLVNGFLVSANFFETLGVQPLLGRAFLSEEEEPGKDREVILSHGLWERRFGSDPKIVGETVTLDGKGHTVVGVMGEDVDFPPSAQLWMPLAMDAKEKAIRNSHYFTPLARLKPGVSMAEAQAEMRAIQGRIQEAFPQTDKGWTARVVPLRSFAVGEYSRQYSILLWWAVLFVLLIACANVANLQLARSTARQKEFAVRAALGAGRWRVVRQLLTESVLLSLAGAGIGLVLAEWAIDLILSHMPPEVARYIPAWKHIGLDREAFAYSLGIALLAGLISGIAPAFQSSKLDLNEELKEGGRSSTAGRARHRLRNAFVVAEVALSLILLMGAGLMVKGVRSLMNLNQNFAPESLLTMRIQLPESKYKDPPAQVRFYEQTLQQLETVPRIKSAAVVTRVPFGDGGLTDRFTVEGKPAQPGELQAAHLESISSDYFRLMNIPLRSGREFADQDAADSTPVAVISEGLARRYWPGENPLGKKLKRGLEDSKNPWATVVGVVGEIKYDPWDRAEFPALYLPYRQAPHSYSYVTIRTEGDPTSFIAAVRSRIASVDSDQPIFDIFTLDKVIRNQILGLSYVAVMLTVTGVIALVLAAVGVYGVMAYAVTERTHEIGVRMALGARPRDVLRLVLTRGVFITAVGLAIGLPISILLARLLASLLFGVAATDLATFFDITLLLTAIALLACYIPARRAMLLDPMIALRYE